MKRWHWMVGSAASVICLIVLAGCGDAEQPGFTFEVQANVSSDVTSVLADGVPLPFGQDANGPNVVYSHRFETYDEALAAPPVTIEFMSGIVVLATGQSVVGACEQSCIDPHCPTASTIIRENLHVPQRDFGVAEYTCATCVGPQYQVLVCTEPL